MGWVQLSSLVRPKRHGTVCIIGPKDEARIHGPRVSSGLYIQEVIYMAWVQLSSLVRPPKRHVTTCVIGPKGEARIHGLRASSVPKTKLGHSNLSQKQILIFLNLYTWIGFNYLTWLGPKEIEQCVLLVPKVKLGYLNHKRHHVILPLVMAILGFLTIPWLGPKDIEPSASSVPKAKLGHSNRVHHRFVK